MSQLPVKPRRQRKRPGSAQALIADSNGLADRITEDGALAAATEVRNRFAHWSKFCESPIESIFLAQILHPRWPAEYRYFDQPISVEVGHVAKIENCTPPPDFTGIYIYPQTHIGSFRVDFYVVWSKFLGQADFDRRVIVECDGHDFHERSKDQVRRDKARERRIVASGVPVLRFSGSEIYRSSEECVEEVLTFLMDIT